MPTGNDNSHAWTNMKSRFRSLVLYGLDLPLPSAFCPLPSSRLPSCLTPSPPGSSKPVKPTFCRNFRICLCPLPSALAVYHLVPHAVTPSPPPSQRPASASASTSANRNFRFGICDLPITGM
ncbi:hypothetical protein TIFTF001_047325 [Ficus carica]|uniref:Uncharacterized protein n=1 Tax=Ficus carica TaxID=3494 RepID=A0AA88CY85_FICCA|nr:hypothetical protein TIFTF001_047325 [Ficus carica]